MCSVLFLVSLSSPVFSHPEYNVNEIHSTPFYWRPLDRRYYFMRYVTFRAAMHALWRPTLHAEYLKGPALEGRAEDRRRKGHPQKPTPSA